MTGHFNLLWYHSRELCGIICDTTAYNRKLKKKNWGEIAFTPQFKKILFAHSLVTVLRCGFAMLVRLQLCALQNHEFFLAHFVRAVGDATHADP